MAVAVAACVTAALTGVTVTARADTTIIFPPDFHPGDSIVASDGRCLTADPATMFSNGGAVQMNTCQYTSNQSWLFRQRGDVNGQLTVIIVNRASGLCLDADNGSLPFDPNMSRTFWREYGATRVQMWECNGWDNQLFVIDHTDVRSSSPVGGVSAANQVKFRVRTRVQYLEGFTMADHVVVSPALTPQLYLHPEAEGRPAQLDDLSNTINFRWNIPSMECAYEGLGPAQYHVIVPLPDIEFFCQR